MSRSGDKDPASPGSAWPNLTGDPNAAPRCGARTKRGGTCRQPGMPNGRCRLHGGKSTGPRTAEGLARVKAARTTHGAFTAESRQLRALVRELRQRGKKLVEEV